MRCWKLSLQFGCQWVGDVVARAMCEGWEVTSPVVCDTKILSVVEGRDGMLEDVLAVRRRGGCANRSAWEPRSPLDGQSPKGSLLTQAWYSPIHAWYACHATAP